HLGPTIPTPHRQTPQPEPPIPPPFPKRSGRAITRRERLTENIATDSTSRVCHRLAIAMPSPSGAMTVRQRPLFDLAPAVRPGLADFHVVKARVVVDAGLIGLAGARPHQRLVAGPALDVAVLVELEPEQAQPLLRQVHRLRGWR